MVGCENIFLKTLLNIIWKRIIIALVLHSFCVAASKQQMSVCLHFNFADLQRWGIGASMNWITRCKQATRGIIDNTLT